jgi:hypothetical protein
MLGEHVANGVLPSSQLQAGALVGLMCCSHRPSPSLQLLLQPLCESCVCSALGFFIDTTFDNDSASRMMSAPVHLQ